jgi:Tfp pilus assembly protein PilX
MSRLRDHVRQVRLGSEDGVAMIIAMIVLLIMSGLVTAAVATSTQTNGSTRRDAFKKNALEAAEAGLQIATYRLNMLRPDNSHCVGDAAALPDSTGWCASSSYTLGNGSTYQYYTTPVLSSTGTCVGLTVSDTTNISNRCITAIGTTNGITARSQIRVAAFGAVPLFPVPGITGLNGLTDGDSAQVGGTEASNKNVTGGNISTVITGGVELGPGAAYTGGATVVQYRLPNPLVLGPVDPGTSNQTSLANCPARQAAGYTTCNDDYRIANYIANPTTPTPPNEDPSSGFTFNSTTRVLTAGNGNASLTLGGGLYNFCEIDIKNNATISLATGVKAEIFIDSPDDPNSGCPAGTGSFNFKNNVTWSNPSNDPTALQIYVYGWNNGQNAVTFMNNGAFNGVLYAPQSTINLSHNSNNVDFNGAISGNIVNVPNNFKFNWDNRAGTLQARTTGVYYRTAWAQCVPPPSATPGSGCG